MEKCNVWHSENLSFLQCTKVSLLSRMSLNITFWQKLWKNESFGTYKNWLCYSQKRFLFYLDNHSTLFPVLFWPKTTKKKIGIFGGSWSNPIGKMWFWRLFKKWQSKKVSSLSRKKFNIISSLISTRNKETVGSFLAKIIGKMQFWGIWIIGKKGFFSI